MVEIEITFWKNWYQRHVTKLKGKLILRIEDTDQNRLVKNAEQDLIDMLLWAGVDFDEGPHIYTINGDSSFTSVTTWVHKHFEKFDSYKIIQNMMKSKNWTNSKYLGKTANQIKNEWEKK